MKLKGSTLIKASFQMLRIFSSQKSVCIRQVFVKILCLFFLQNLSANEIDLTQSLYSKFYSEALMNQVFKKYIEDDGSLLDAGQARWIARFFTQSEMKDFSQKGLSELRPILHDGRILNAVLYLAWMWNGVKDQEDLVALLELYSIEKEASLRELSSDPRLSGAQRTDARNWLLRLDDDVRQRQLPQGAGGPARFRPRLENCLNQIPAARTTMRLPQYEQAAIVRLGQIKKCVLSSYPARGAQPYAALDLKAIYPQHTGSVISHGGFVPGHKVQVLNLNKNTSDREFSLLFKAIDEGLIVPYRKYWDQFSHDQQIQMMREQILRAKSQGKNPLHTIFIEIPGGSTSDILMELSNGHFFTKEDALSFKTNPVWKFYGPANDHERQTFPQIIHSFQQAEKSIFIDLFFFGGSIGLSMVDFLSQELERKPHLQLMMVRDQVNHFGHRGEMAPVYNYLRAKMSLEPKRLVILPANVFDKQVNGFPEFFKNFLSQDFLNQLGLDEKFSLYIKAQSDHSKIAIIDGNHPAGKPQMIIGSKNWTDSSGAICNDENLLVEGPMAVLALDNYFQDLYIGLKNDWNIKNNFLNQFYENIHKSGWAQNPECQLSSSNQDLRELKILQLLCPFDLLKRYRFDLSKFLQLPRQDQMIQIKVKSQGTAHVRFGENNATASVTTVLNQNLEAIQYAKKQILINEQLFYSPAIVEALKQKVKQGVEVRILLEGFIHEGGQFPGMPNLIYLDELKKSGVQVKWKIHTPFSHFFPEHHGKTISVDGFDSRGERASRQSLPQLIVGSANKDLLTMKGGFRESQVEVIDLKASREHDLLFWKNWNDPQESREATFAEFNASDFGKKIKEQGFTTELFMSYVAEMMEAIYAMKPLAR